MKKVKLGTVLKEEKAKIGLPDGGGLDLIGVSNEYGLHVSRAQRIPNLSKYKIIKTGWFAYNPMRVNVGSIGIAQDANHEGIVSPDYVVFSCSDKILPDYLLFFLKSDIGLEAINKNASGAVRKRLYYSDLARIELNVPSIEKQIEILASVKKIESMVTQLRDPNRKEKVFQLKQSILQEAIQGKLTADWRGQRQAVGIEIEPASELLKRIQAEKARLIKEKKIKKEKPLPPITEEEKPFQLPKGWEWCRLGEMYRFIDYRGKTPNKLKKGVRLLTAKNVRSGFIKLEPEEFVSDSEFKKRMTRGFPRNGDIIFTTEAPLGNAAIINLKEEMFSTGQRVITFQSLICGQENRLFLFFILSPFFQGLLNDNSSGVTATGIKSKRLSNLVLPFPPLEDQKAIVSKVESLMEKCQALEEEISQSEQHAQMLMQAVLKESFENRTREKTEVTSPPAAKLSISPSKKGFAKLVLAGKIISECKDSREFTNIKFQKLQHLAEHLMEADLNLNYYHLAAGPYDPKFMHTVHRKMKEQKWFASWGSGFSPLDKSSEIDRYFDAYFGARAAQFSKLCTLLGNAKESQCEIISTLYAVWNDRIIKGEPTTSELLIEDFYNWSGRKHTYSTNQLQEAILWMKDNKLEPKGFGELIKHAKKKKT